jgi:hypothetical protein
MDSGLGEGGVNGSHDCRVWNAGEVWASEYLVALHGAAIGRVNPANQSPKLASVEIEKGDVGPRFEEREAKESFDPVCG